MPASRIKAKVGCKPVHSSVWLEKGVTMAAAILGVWGRNCKSMKSVLLLSVLALTSASGFLELVPQATNVGSNCFTGTAGYTVETFTLNPWPPARNENVTMSMTGTFNQAESINALMVYVTYNTVAFDTVIIPRSGSYSKGASYKDSYEAFFPNIAPSGSYQVDLKMRNTANQDISCWSVPFKL